MRYPVRRSVRSARGGRRDCMAQRRLVRIAKDAAYAVVEPVGRAVGELQLLLAAQRIERPTTQQMDSTLEASLDGHGDDRWIV